MRLLHAPPGGLSLVWVVRECTKSLTVQSQLDKFSVVVFGGGQLEMLSGSNFVLGQSIVGSSHSGGGQKKVQSLPPHNLCFVGWACGSPTS